MKTNKPTMSHNACYDNKARRWLVAPNDIVVYKDCAGHYFAFVVSVTNTTLSVVRFRDSRQFYIHYLDVDRYLDIVPACDNIVRFLLPDDSSIVFKQGDKVIDTTFEGSMNWYIDKFDKERGRAFLTALISGRTIGHWQDLSKIVKE